MSVGGDAKQLNENHEGCLSMPVSSNFEELSHGVKKWIYRQGWESLRDVQEQSIPVIKNSEADVLITAPTAGGKTEAAFLPIISWIADQEPFYGYGALCLSPLKALINDQHKRLLPLCESANTNITPWHGDIASGLKTKSWKTPSGILLITPESLEAMFVRRPHELRDRIQKLHYIVIDEFHAFIGRERGQQLLSLIGRLESILNRPICRVALSATIGDADMALKYLRPCRSRKAVHIDADNKILSLKISVKGFSADDDSGGSSSASMAKDLYDPLNGHNNLVFGNSRRIVEEIADQLKRIGEKYGAPEQFFVHHGSLSKEARHFVEMRLKSGDHPTTAVATSTLELGLDVGGVYTVAQIGAPANVSSTRQRLGRSGRREGAQSILRVLVEAHGGDGADPIAEIQAELVQTIAVIELMLSRWIEPPDQYALHLSTLVQQILSMVAYTGSVTAKEAYHTLCEKGPWHHFDTKMFARVLRGLGKSNVLSQLRNGEIAVGSVGEKITNSHGFYCAFEVPEEYVLIAYGKTIGSLPVGSPYMPGQLLLFGGQGWRIEMVDRSKKTITLERSKRGRAPIFGGEPAPVHKIIRQKMLKVLLGKNIPKYLDASARNSLVRAREYFKIKKIHQRHVVAGGDFSYLFVWDDDRVLNALKTAASLSGYAVDSVGPCLVIDGVIDDTFLAALLTFMDGVTTDELVGIIHAQPLGKYDHLLPAGLLGEAYVQEKINWEGAKEYLRLRVVGCTSELKS